MAEQLIFELPPQTAFGRDDFFVSPCNHLAVATIENWRNWPLKKLVLCGPKGSGKSHLAHIWAEDTGAIVVNAKALAYERLETLSQQPIVVEDVQSLAGNSDAESALFHLHNLLQETGHPLLMTGQGTINSWGIELPDLLSRLSGTQLMNLDLPDDTLLSVLLVKLFADRQMTVTPALIAYIVKRMDRSFLFAGELVERLDRASLAGKQAITKPFASKVLKKLHTETISNDQGAV